MQPNGKIRFLIDLFNFKYDMHLHFCINVNEYGEIKPDGSVGYQHPKMGLIYDASYVGQSPPIYCMPRLNYSPIGII